MNIRFVELPVGARFEFRGRRYEKMGTDIARDEERCGNRFHDNTDVFADLPPVKAASRVRMQLSTPNEVIGECVPYVRRASQSLGAGARVWED